MEEDTVGASTQDTGPWYNFKAEGELQESERAIAVSWLVGFEKAIPIWEGFSDRHVPRTEPLQWYDVMMSCHMIIFS